VSVYYSDDLVTLHHGDCREVMADLPACSVDAVVTDPPYELGFMGKGWDASGIAYNQDVWDQAHRILKPGGHLLAFGGTRTWHRLAVAIEDAGFEVRDSIAWMYGSGFPKSLDVSKAIDKKRDDREDILRVTSEIARLRDIAGLSNRDLDDAFGFAGMAGHWTSTKSQPTVPRVEQWSVLRDMLNPDAWLDDEVWRLNGRKGKPGEAWAEREVTGQYQTPAAGQQWNANYGLSADLTAKERKDIPATPAAEQWQGWGTALKPAHEPIVVARKPLDGTVAENVLTHGTGALNIDASRIGYASEADKDQALAGDAFKRKDTSDKGWSRPWMEDADRVAQMNAEAKQRAQGGRWPANVILDESQAAELDRQADERPARFFYVPKANASERPKDGDTAHPTVKPLDLMRYLVKLVTPPGGTVLEPFAGSGTTLEACVVEGFHVIGIELTEDYLPLIVQRLSKPIEQVLW
jgi:DNA modification methylase